MIVADDEPCRIDPVRRGEAKVGGQRENQFVLAHAESQKRGREVGIVRFGERGCLKGVFGRNGQARKDRPPVGEHWKEDLRQARAIVEIGFADRSFQVVDRRLSIPMETS